MHTPPLATSRHNSPIRTILFLLFPTAALGATLSLGAENVTAFRVLLLIAIVLSTSHAPALRPQPSARTWESTQSRTRLPLGVVWAATGFIHFTASSRNERVISESVNLLIGLLAVWTATSRLQSNEDIDWAARGWLLAYASTLGCGYYETFTGHRFSTYSRDPSLLLSGPEPASTLGNQNNFALFIAMSLCIMAGLWHKWRTLRARAALLILILLGLPILLATNSQASTIAAAMALITALWVATPPRLRPFSGIVGLFVLLASWYLLTDAWRQNLSEYRAPLTQQHSPLGLRVTLTQNGFDILEASHYLGAGPGGFSRYHSIGEVSRDTSGVIDAHNLWIEVLSQYGAPVFLLFLLLILRTAKHAFSALHSTVPAATPPSSDVRWRSTSILAACALLPVGAFAPSSWLQMPIYWLFFAYILLVSRGLPNLASPKPAQAACDAEARELNPSVTSKG